MKRTIFLLVIITLILGGLTLRGSNSQGLTSPGSDQVISTQPSLTIPSPSPAYQFNSQTNLKSELETINPEVDDPTIDQLKQVISNL